MGRVIGLGGVFFRSQDPAALRAWYHTHLGLDVQPHGVTFQPARLPKGAYNVWAPFAQDTTYFGDSGQTFMVNLIVDDLPGCLDAVRQAGATLVKGPEEDADYGIFGWFDDPDGNRIELWQPAAELPADVK